MFLLLLGLWGCTERGKNTLDIDNDGDGYTEFAGDCDDANALLNLNDNDGDGFSSCAGDCNDENPLIYPGAAAKDSLTECLHDNDGDGFGSAIGGNGANFGTDCDDNG